MNKYRIGNPNTNNELDYKSSSTLRTNPARRNTMSDDDSSKPVDIRYRTPIGWWGHKSTTLKDSVKVADEIKKNGNTIK